jgi:tetrapyrrole methylase family protein / MazG family protein
VGRDRPCITVVGLGPAGPEYLNDEVKVLMAGAEQLFLRTARHPAAAGLTGATTFDHLYETADTFDEVYAAVVEQLFAAATGQAPGAIVYAVPGSPLIAERTVELLRADDRIDCTVLPSVSFLDLVWERLAIDPLTAGVRLVDAEHFGPGMVGEHGPFLVGQCWSASLLSDIKLSIHIGDSEVGPEVVLLHHLGLEDEEIRRVSWWDLDRTLQPDHLTSLYIPRLEDPVSVEGEMARLDELVRTLRMHCPWDRAQTHATLMPHLVEEAYEVLDALEEIAGSGSPVPLAAPALHLEEELGDLLFQIVFHARLAQEEELFTLADVARGVHDKLVHRHPHVFGDVDATTPEDVVKNWETIKKEEKGRTSVTEGIAAHLPSLLLSTKLQRKALSIGLPADSVDVATLTQQLALLSEATGRATPPHADAVLSADETALDRTVGELLFGVASLARRLGIDPELALRSRAVALREAIVRRETEHGTGDSGR